ncbi:MAG TPA: S41 family peptidase [Verrucomicrobiae bacterium]
MLQNLHDLHVWLTLAGVPVPVYSRPRPDNANPHACKSILGGIPKETGRIIWAVTQNHIGFIAIFGWDDDTVPAQCAEALEKMRDTRGLIVDVRLNGGGSDKLAEQFAARFVEKNFTYAYSQFRNGPSHTDLTEKYPRVIKPGGPWRYDRPVILLIGQKCLSSDESFVGMMTGDPLVTTMGDHTGGSSGNPKIIKLPLDMTVSVPQWIDYLPDGTLLDGHGFQPQIPFTPAPGAFLGERDDLLTAALERLAQQPLPGIPIEGPAFTGSARKSPEIVEMNPANEAGDVDPALSELRVTFDVPMGGGMSWCGGGPNFPEVAAGAKPHWSEDGRTCVLPVKLKPGRSYNLGLNSASFHNFRSAKGVPLAPVAYSFRTRQP